MCLPGRSRDVAFSAGACPPGVAGSNVTPDLSLAVESWRAYNTGVFVIELIYKADLARIDQHMPAHVAFLKKHYASGNFLVSGRKIPRTGGIILAVGKSLKQIQAIVEADPFVARGLADFRIIEFRASQRASDIQKRIDDQS